MQGEVDLRKRLLLLDCTDGIVHVLGLVDFLRIVVHVGELFEELWGWGRGRGVWM